MENIYDPEFVKGLFNRMSNSYERMNFITSFGFSIRWRRQFLKHFISLTFLVVQRDFMGNAMNKIRISAYLCPSKITKT